MLVYWLVTFILALFGMTADSLIFKNRPNIKNKRIITKSVVIFILFMVLASVGRQELHPIMAISQIACTISAFLLLMYYARRSVHADNKSIELINRDGINELMVSSANGDYNAVKRLVESGEPIDSQSLSGSTALMYAARNDKYDIIELLIDLGANHKILNNKEMTALDIANKFKSKKSARILVKLS